MALKDKDCLDQKRDSHCECTSDAENKHCSFDGSAPVGAVVVVLHVQCLSQSCLLVRMLVALNDTKSGL